MKEFKLPKICLFGNYNSLYSRTAVIIKGLRENGINIVDCHNEIGFSKIERDGDLSLSKIVKKIKDKLRIFWIGIAHIKEIGKTDAILVLYPGHFELLAAFLVRFLTQKPIIFDVYISLAEMFGDEKSIFKKNSFFYKILELYERLVYNNCDKLIVGSEEDKKYFSSKFRISKKKIDVLYIGADTDVFKKRKYLKNLKSFGVSYLGSFSPYHGVEYILEAAKLLEKEKNIQFYLVGKGQKLDSICELLETLELKNLQIVKHNRINEKIYQIFNKSHVFLGIFSNKPLVARTVPNKVFQGLAMGKTVVTSDSKAIREIDKKGEGLCLIKAIDSNSLAKTILELNRDRDLAENIALSGYKNFQNNYSPKKIGETLITIVNNI